MAKNREPCERCVDMAGAFAAWNEENAGSGEWCDLNALLRPHDGIEQMALRDAGADGTYLLYRCTTCNHWWVVHFNEDTYEIEIVSGGAHLLKEWQTDEP